MACVLYDFTSTVEYIIFHCGTNNFGQHKQPIKNCRKIDKHKLKINKEKL